MSLQQGETNRKCGGGIFHAGRGLAQLPPLIPLGLQGRGARQLHSQPIDLFNRFHGAHRAGLRPQNAKQGDRREAQHQQGRRNQQSLGKKTSQGLRTLLF